MMLINGKFVDGEDGEFEVINPYDNKVVGYAPIASKKQIEEAIEVTSSFKCKLSKKERANALERIGNSIEKESISFSEIITKESGLSLKETRAQVARSILSFHEAARYLRENKEDLTSQFLQCNNAPKITVISEPMKLVVAITPFNLPLYMVTSKLIPAIAAGAGMILKPSEKTPLTALKLAKILDLPDGMVNIITSKSPQKIVKQLVTSPKTDMVSYTGGVEVGKHIKRIMVENCNELKKFVAELGGNSAFTILSDADIDLAAKLAVEGAFGNTGQRCTAIKRILVVPEVKEKFLNRFIELTKKLKCGDPMDENNDIGTVITEEAAKVIEAQVDKAINNGAKLILGHKREGALYHPTILDNVKPNDPLVILETFGPVAPIINVKDIDEAIKVINSVEYKLAGAVACKKKEDALKIADAICVGQFNWNSTPVYRTELAPFGGFGISGNCEKEGIVMGIEGMKKIRTFYEH